MRRIRLEIGLVLLTAMLGTPLWGQTTRDAGKASLSREEAARLDRTRQIIENLDDSMGTRRVQAEELLRMPLPAAGALAVDLLGPGRDPSTKIAIGEAIANVGAENPALLSERHAGLIDPLMRLLGDPAPGVSEQASDALAAYADGGVTERLGALAANPEASLSQRLAAVDALALSAYKREVVRQLVQLLQGENGEMRTRVLNALRSVSSEDYGVDVAAWQAWWQGQQESQSESQWLVDRVKLFFDRLQQAKRQIAVQRTTAEQRYAMLAQRTTDLLRDHYRLNPQPPQKEELLRRWLADPLVVYRLAALAIISEEIQEGRLPTGPVIEGVVQGLTHRSPEIRRAVLGILGALSDPSNTGAVLALLEEERDGSVRQTAFRVLGQLRSPEALSAVVREIQVTTGSSAPAGCVAEAAAALALIGAKGKLDAAALAAAVPALRDRFAQTPADNGHIRASLLRAMVSIGAQEFGPIFREALGSELPDELLPAIEGSVVLHDTESLKRILSLAGQADPRVRIVAVRAIGELGGAPAHLEVLLARLGPGTESNDGVRVAAWAAWCGLVEAMPPAEQLQWAERLREVPDRYVESLSTFIANLAGRNPPSAELAEGRRRLATYFSEVGNHAGALPVWQQLHSQLRAANDAQAEDVAIRVLTESLAANQGGVITETLTLLATAKPSVKARAGRVVTDFINANRPQLEPDVIYALIEAVAAAPLDEYDAAFRTFIADARQQLTPARPTPTTTPSTEG